MSKQAVVLRVSQQDSGRMVGMRRPEADSTSSHYVVDVGRANYLSGTDVVYG